MRSIIVGLGEILWDMLPDGKQLGDAHANFSYHSHALDLENVSSYIISAIGNDKPGKEILNYFDKHSINSFLASLPADSVRIFDINLRQSYFSLDIIQKSLNLANVFKINDDELRTITKLMKISGQDKKTWTSSNTEYTEIARRT